MKTYKEQLLLEKIKKSDILWGIDPIQFVDRVYETVVMYLENNLNGYKQLSKMERNKIEDKIINLNVDIMCGTITKELMKISINDD